MDRALDKEQLSLLLKSYHRLRDTGKRLNSKLIKYLPGEVINSTARTLGLMKDGILVLGNMDQSSILMDQCLYTYRVNGKTVFETYLENNPVPPHSEECMLLNAWKSARYALLSIEKIEPGFGVYVIDGFREDRLFLMDVNLSQSVMEGFLLASRIINPNPDFYITTGAALPIYGDAAEIIVRGLKLKYFSKNRSIKNLSRAEIDEMSAFIIRVILSQESSSRIEYKDPPSVSSEGAEVPQRGGRKIGRNEPCPCGSGKKYKKCCGT